MNPPVAPSQDMTMTSKEMADLTEKRHDNVKRTIETLANQGIISRPQIEEVSNDGPGPKTISLYRIGKRDSYVIVAQLSPEFTARLVDRWQELETKQAQPAFALPDFTNPAIAARAWADQVEKSQVLGIEVAQTKAQLAIAAPKVEAFDRMETDPGTVTFTQASKVLSIKRSDLSALMHREGWIYRQNESWVAYDQYIKNGCLQYKEANYTDDKTGMACRKPYCHITSKGLAKLALMVAPQHMVMTGARKPNGAGIATH